MVPILEMHKNLLAPRARRRVITTNENKIKCREFYEQSIRLINKSNTFELIFSKINFVVRKIHGKALGICPVAMMQMPRRRNSIR